MLVANRELISDANYEFQASINRNSADYETRRHEHLRFPRVRSVGEIGHIKFNLRPKFIEEMVLQSGIPQQR
jgi:hypothetical protein